MIRVISKLIKSELLVPDDRPLPINDYHSPLYMNQHLVHCIESKGQWFSVTPVDGSKKIMHEYVVLQI